MSLGHAGDPLSVGEIAELVGGEVLGDGEVVVRGISPLDGAEVDSMALLSDRRYLDALSRTRAGALLLSPHLASHVPGGLPAVVVDDPHLALTLLLPRLYPPHEPEAGVHATAVVGRGVRLGSGVRIGPYAVIEEGCELGDDVTVSAHCVLGRGARVGAESLLHPHVVLYPETVLGSRVIVHAGARLGSDGFGYAFSAGAFHKVPQVGGCRVEDDVEIGANSCVDRGSIGETVIGRGSKLDNLVQVAHNVQIGEHSALAAQVGIAGSTRIGAHVVFAGQSGSVGHVEIGARARIGAKAGVTSDVAPGESVAGFPARELRRFMRATALTLKLPELARRVRALEGVVGRKPAESESEESAS